jgi:hypothetical protein
MTTLTTIATRFQTRLVWWPNFETLAAREWFDVVDVLWFDTAITASAGDWLRLHQLIETYNAKTGRVVKVIRRLAKYLVPDQLDASFDATWRHQLAYIDVADEAEDKQVNPDGSPANVFSTPQPIIDYFSAAANEARAALPGVPVLANFNGTHLQPGLKATYDRIVRGAKLDAVCSDSYPEANQQVDAAGKLLYPDPIAEAVNGPTLLKQWFPDLKVFGFVGTGNQQLYQKGSPGWSPGWTAAGSVAWTPPQFGQVTGKMLAAGVDGLAYFPQGRNGAINDVTDPALWPLIRQMAGLAPGAAPAAGNVGAANGSDDPIVSIAHTHASGRTDYFDRRK